MTTNDTFNRAQAYALLTRLGGNEPNQIIRHAATYIWNSLHTPSKIADWPILDEHACQMIDLATDTLRARFPETWILTESCQ